MVGFHIATIVAVGKTSKYDIAIVPDYDTLCYIDCIAADKFLPVHGTSCGIELHHPDIFSAITSTHITTVAALGASRCNQRPCRSVSQRLKVFDIGSTQAVLPYNVSIHVQSQHVKINAS